MNWGRTRLQLFECTLSSSWARGNSQANGKGRREISEGIYCNCPCPLKYNRWRYSIDEPIVGKATEIPTKSTPNFRSKVEVNLGNSYVKDITNDFWEIIIGISILALHFISNVSCPREKVRDTPSLVVRWIKGPQSVSIFRTGSWIHSVPKSKSDCIEKRTPISETGKSIIPTSWTNSNHRQQAYWKDHVLAPIVGLEWKVPCSGVFQPLPKRSSISTITA